MFDRFIGIAIVGIGAALLGCSAMSKVKECNGLIERINQSVTKMDGLTKAGTDLKPVDLRTMATEYESLVKDIDGMNLRTEQLKGHAKDYQAMAQKFSGGARQLADAIEKKDLEGQQAGSKQLQGLEKTEDELVNKINTFCTQ